MYMNTHIILHVVNDGNDFLFTTAKYDDGVSAKNGYCLRQT
jgi:hypothetical protein